MATTERWDTEAGPCPCGEGKVMVHVESPDHPWGGGSQTHSISCEKCKKDWEIEGKNFVQISSKKEFEDAQKRLRRISADIRDVVVTTVNANAGSFGTQTACLKWMDNLGIARGNIALFRKHLKSGKSAGEFAIVSKNSDMANLCDQAARIGKKDRLAELFREEKAAQKACNEAAKKIVKKPMK